MFHWARIGRATISPLQDMITTKWKLPYGSQDFCSPNMESVRGRRAKLDGNKVRGKMKREGKEKEKLVYVFHKEIKLCDTYNYITECAALCSWKVPKGKGWFNSENAVSYLFMNLFLYYFLLPHIFCL